MSDAEEPAVEGAESAVEGAESGVAEYGSFLKDKLAAEDARKASLEQRGLAVITTSGVLVTLLFGLGALSTKEAATFTLDPDAASVLAIALILFVGAAICALITNAPFLAYQEVSPEDLESRLEETPIRTTEEATEDIAVTRVSELKSAGQQNGRKALVLLAAMGLEVAAVAATAIAIWIILNPF